MANSRLGFIGFGGFTLLMVVGIDNFCNCARSDQETRERFYGNSLTNATLHEGEDSIAKMIDHVLEKEFSENDQPEGSDASSFNNSVADKQAELETVVKISREKSKKNDTGDVKYGNNRKN